VSIMADDRLGAVVACAEGDPFAVQAPPLTAR
jgi:hypothetical protein